MENSSSLLSTPALQRHGIKDPPDERSAITDNKTKNQRLIYRKFAERPKADIPSALIVKIHHLYFSNCFIFFPRKTLRCDSWRPGMAAVSNTGFRHQRSCHHLVDDLDHGLHWARSACNRRYGEPKRCLFRPQPGSFCHIVIFVGYHFCFLEKQVHMNCPMKYTNASGTGISWGMRYIFSKSSQLRCLRRLLPHR